MENDLWATLTIREAATLLATHAARIAELEVALLEILPDEVNGVDLHEAAYKLALDRAQAWDENDGRDPSDRDYLDAFLTAVKLETSAPREETVESAVAQMEDCPRWEEK